MDGKGSPDGRCHYKKRDTGNYILYNTERKATFLAAGRLGVAVFWKTQEQRPLDRGRDNNGHDNEMDGVDKNVT